MFLFKNDLSFYAPIQQIVITDEVTKENENATFLSFKKTSSQSRLFTLEKEKWVSRNLLIHN